MLDNAGAPRREVLLAAIMIRRGRTAADIASATGLPLDLVGTLARVV